MVDLSDELKIKATIQSGMVFYFVEETFSSSEPHYFIVLNKDPLSDELLLLVCSSSQVDKVKWRRRHLSQDTLVEISQTEYKDFTVSTSIIDCNTAIIKSIDQLIEKSKQGQLELKSVMSAEIVNKLRLALLASPLISQGIKNILLQPE